MQTVAELGVVIFNALDFGLKVSLTSSMSIGRLFCYLFKLSSVSKKEDEERQLSPALENIIDMMTSSGEYDDIISDDDTMISLDDDDIVRDVKKGLLA